MTMMKLTKILKYLLNIFTDWVRFIARAGYESRDSNIAGKDYNNRYIMATIDFSYNIGKR